MSRANPPTKGKSTAERLDDAKVAAIAAARQWCSRIGAVPQDMQVIGVDDSGRDEFQVTYVASLTWVIDGYTYSAVTSPTTSLASISSVYIHINDQRSRVYPPYRGVGLNPDDIKRAIGDALERYA